MGELYPRHEKRTKNPAETTGNRYEIEILMSRTQKLKGLVAASLRVKNIKRQSLKYNLNSPKLEHIRQVCYTHTRMTPIVRNCVSNKMNMVFTVWCQFAQ